MANVRLHVAGRIYDVSCADGDEPHLEQLAALVNEKTEQAKLVVGDVNEVRQLLFAAIFLADELQGLRAGTSAAEPIDSTMLDSEIKAIAQHIDEITKTVLAAR